MIDWLLNQEGSVISAFLLSAVSLCISLLTIILQKKAVSTQTISINRVQWIKDVRNLLFEFIKEYITKANKRKLYYIRCKISLYMRKGVDSYEGLLNALDKCVNEKANDQNCQNLINEAQIVLADVWKRMKREAMITEKLDKKIEKQYNEAYKKTKKCK